MRTNIQMKGGKYVLAGGRSSALEATKSFLNATDAKRKALAEAANREFVERTVTGTVHVDHVLQNLSVKYKNDEFIGDHLLPVVPVAERSASYFTYNKRDAFGAPDDQMGPRATANEITKGRSTANYSVKDYALKDFLDIALHVQNASAPLNEMADIIVDLNERLALKREIRQAAILTTAANYGSNTAALGSTVRWDDTAGDPIGDLLFADAALFNGAGASKKVAFTSLAGWHTLVKNQQLQSLFQYTREGLLDPMRFADYFGIDELWVGRARKDTANEGQTASYSRIWGDVFGLIRVATAPSLRNASFGVTMRWKGEMLTTTVLDPLIGRSGGYWGQVATSEDIKIIAPDTGFLYTSILG
jgi:hypothetical protein